MNIALKDRQRLSERGPEKVKRQSGLHRNKDAECGRNDRTLLTESNNNVHRQSCVSVHPHPADSAGCQSRRVRIDHGRSDHSSDRPQWRWISTPRGITQKTANMKPALIDLDAEMQTGGKQAAMAVQPERLSEREPGSGLCDSLASQEINCERGTRSGSSRAKESVSNKSGPCLELLDRKVVEPRGITNETAKEKLSLIDLDAEMQTGRKQAAMAVQRERLSETAPGSRGCDSLVSREMNRERGIRSGSSPILVGVTKRQVHDWPIRPSHPPHREFPGACAMAQRCRCNRRRHSSANVHNGTPVDAVVNAWTSTLVGEFRLPHLRSFFSGEKLAA